LRDVTALTKLGSCGMPALLAGSWHPRLVL